MIVVTNNPLVLEKIRDNHPVNGTPLDVMLETRKYLSSGGSLASMPLPANQRLFINPYRSIVVDNGTDANTMKSMDLLEKAIERFREQKFNDDPSSDSDFALMDLEQVLTVIEYM